MEACSRVRQAFEVVDVFETPDIEFDDDESDSENDDRVETQSAHESERDDEQIEIKEEPSDGESSTQPSRRCRTKSGFVWSSNAPDPLDCQTQYVAAPKGQALNVTTPLEAWTLLFSDEILNVIVTHTNEEIARTAAKIKENGGRVESHQKPLDVVELKAVMGLLYFAGMHKVSNTSTRNLWSPYGFSLFRLTMPQNRFAFLLLSMRFDDKNTRVERKAEDRLAHIREVWNMFIANCTANYNPHTNCTIEEQLLTFSGRCLFRVYMPTKSNRYGLKIVSINDATTHYMFDAIPYVGTVDKDPSETVSSYYIRKLSESIYHTGRNIFVFYNKTKGRTDSFDQKCHDYTTARKTRRWPMRYFYGMLDQANVNCLILYTSCEDNFKMKRTDFILDLSLSLIRPLLTRRLTSSTLRTTLRVQIEALVNHTDIPEDRDPHDLLAENKIDKRKRCFFCPSALDRKTNYKCLRCEQPMCREHVAKVCCYCSLDMGK